MMRILPAHGASTNCSQHAGVCMRISLLSLPFGVVQGVYYAPLWWYNRVLLTTTFTCSPTYKYMYLTYLFTYNCAKACLATLHCSPFFLTFCIVIHILYTIYMHNIISYSLLHVVVLQTPFPLLRQSRVYNFIGRFFFCIFSSGRETRLWSHSHRLDWECLYFGFFRILAHPLHCMQLNSKTRSAYISIYTDRCVIKCMSYMSVCGLVCIMCISRKCELFLFCVQLEPNWMNNIALYVAVLLTIVLRRNTHNVNDCLWFTFWMEYSGPSFSRISMWL